MNLNCNVKVVDSIMGSGKSQAIINHINKSSTGEKFLVITPFLDEVERYREFCPKKNFKTPFFSGKSKLDDLRKLIEQGENIVSTHALFQKFDKSLISLCKNQNYTLILDEVAEIISEYPISRSDIDLLLEKYAYIQEESGRIFWRPEYSDYHGLFDPEKKICEYGGLAAYNNNLVVWLFPAEAFMAFHDIYVLTYQFNLQLQRYYYDYYGISYTYMGVEGDKLENYHLIPIEKKSDKCEYEFKKLIHVSDIPSLNKIGEDKHALSKAWFERNKNTSEMDQLKNNIFNYFRNVCHSASSNNLWTTFKKYQSSLKGKGYTKSFVPLNSRATNQYRNRTVIVYPVNRYLNPYVKNFFSTNGIKIDEDGYALSEMLQFIWRSAIREGKEIYIYVPSSRMRKLLKDWIEKNSHA